MLLAEVGVSIKFDFHKFQSGATPASKSQVQISSTKLNKKGQNASAARLPDRLSQLQLMVGDGQSSAGGNK